MRTFSNIRRLFRSAAILMLAVVAIQCKTFSNASLKDESPSFKEEWDRFLLQYTMPFGIDQSHYANPDHFRKTCQQSAFPFYLGKDDTMWGPGQNLWEPTQTDLVTIDPKTENIFAKQYNVIMNLEIKCTEAAIIDNLNGCRGAKNWKAYRSLGYQLDTINNPILARNFVMLVKHNYFTDSAADNLEPYPAASCNNPNMGSATLEKCLSIQQFPYPEPGTRCDQLPKYTFVHNNPQFAKIPFAAFMANDMFRTFTFELDGAHPSLGSKIGQAPYTIVRELTRYTKAYPMDIVVTSSGVNSYATRLTLYNPDSVQPLESNALPAIARYMQPDGPDVMVEMHNLIRAGNQIRIREMRLVPAGEKQISRNAGKMPAIYNDTFRGNR